MERPTFSVLFFIRRTRLNKHGEAPVEMRLTINGIRIDHALKRSVPPDFWNPDKGRAMPRTRECRELNAYLDTVKLRLLQLQREMEIDGIPVTAKSLLDKYLGIDETPRRTLLEVFREHNDKCAKLSGIDMSPATVERYETSYKHTAEFIAAVYGKKDIYLDDVNHKFIVDYEFYLKTERRCAHNTATKYLKNFKKIIRIALANEWITKDPFANIKFRLDEVNRDFLEEHELKRVMEKSLPIERLAQVRDAFIFACFTGLAFSDLQGLREEHLVRDGDGSMWIRKKRQKTKNMCNIPLLKVPLEIIERYRAHPECVRKGVLLPVMSNQKMNAYLRELADICGITKQISTHTGRHTFASCVALANGVSMESVAKMLGHSNTNMTRHYARVLDRTIINEMGKVAAKFENC
jgi:site-specific recombinase XerD